MPKNPERDPSLTLRMTSVVSSPLFSATNFGSSAFKRRCAVSFKYHCPFLSIPIGTTSYFSLSIASITFFADWSETSCSAERPLNSTATLVFFFMMLLYCSVSRRFCQNRSANLGLAFFCKKKPISDMFKRKNNENIDTVSKQFKHCRFCCVAKKSSQKTSDKTIVIKNMRDIDHRIKRE